MVRKLDWHLEAIELLRQSVLESGGDLQNESDNLVEAKLEHRAKIMLVSNKVRDVKRTIRYCQRCKVSWPCLVAQEEAIERGRIRRRHSHLL